MVVIYPVATAVQLRCITYHHGDRMKVDFTTGRFVSLEDAGFEEDYDLPVFGLQEAESSRHGIYSYMDWFYDADDSAFSIL